jgi:hypothetical protein
MIRATQITVTGGFVGATSIAQVSFPFTFWFDLFYFIFFLHIGNYLAPYDIKIS